MIKSLKIQTAILLSTVFIFRLLFVNIGINSSLSVQQKNSTVKSHFSSHMKRRKHVEIINDSKSCDYPVAEMCEEDSDDDDDQFNANPFILLQALYSSLAGETDNKLKKIQPLHASFSDTSSPRYLICRVFRI